jgi:hypothetical protein
VLVVTSLQFILHVWLISIVIPKVKIVVPSRVTRVNSTNVLDEGLRIREIGRRMNSKVKLVEIGMRRK